MFGRKKTEPPTWLPEAKQLCRDAGIEIAAWGPEALVVVAASEEQIQLAKSVLGNLGFQPIEDANDAGAGLLTLSRNPELTIAQQRRK